MNFITINQFTNNLQNLIKQVIDQHTPLKITNQDGADFVNKCAYFDYQRDKIYFREKTSNKRKQNQCTTKRRAEKYKINKTILVTVPEVCSHCGGTKLYYQIYRSKVVLDVKFLEFGIKRWI